MNAHDLFVVEARNEDGSLNVKYYNPEHPKSFITGINENDLFRYYFKHNKDVGAQTWKQLTEWFGTQGLSIRKKTW